MKIYFVRHGESEGNLSCTIQSREEPLTDIGRYQALCLAKSLKENIFDGIIASEHVRAKQTAQIISEHLKIPIEHNNLFGEIRYPSSIQGMGYFSEEAKSTIELLRKHFHNLEFRHSDEETFTGMKQRGKDALDFLKRKNEQDLLVVTHGTFLKMLLGLVLFGDSIDSYAFERLRYVFFAKNTSVTTIEYLETGHGPASTKWRFLGFNDCSHLVEEVSGSSKIAEF